MKFLRHAKAPTTRRPVVPGGRPQAFSYHANRLEQDYNLGRFQPREQDKRKRLLVFRYWRSRIGILVAGLVIIFCILDILHLSPDPHIVALTTSSDSSFLQPTAVYEQAASQLFRSSLFNANKITINSDAIAAKLQQEFPELAAVSVTLPLVSHRPIVYIAPTPPSLILNTLHSGSFVLSSSGKALINLSQARGLNTQKLPTVTDETGIRIKPGQVALASSAVSFIQSVSAELAAKGVSVSGYSLPTAAEELDVHLNGAGYFIKFTMHDSSTALQQVGTFLAVRQRLQAQNTTPGSYIDVRVQGRAYYK